MKICTTEQEFIEYVAPFAQKVCKRYGFYLTSVLVAQACKEVGYGIPSYWDNPGVRGLIEENNMIGIKKSLLNASWTDIGLGCWDGKYLSKKTPEVYGGKQVIITDDFRIYDNVEQSFADYMCFMRWGAYQVGGTPKYYPNIKDLHDYKSLISKVHSLGYATGPTYASGVCKIIEKHNLTKYDDLTNVEPSTYYPASGQKEVQVNSPLVNYTALSPCNSGQRTHAIDRITPHCIVGQLDVETIGVCFNSTAKKASSNYGIGSDARVGMYVPENMRSWCTSSSENDQRAVTIECACDLTAPYAFKSIVYNKLIELCVDICKRNGKKKLLWLGDKETTLRYNPAADECVLSAHRWMAAKSCPGDWMYSREGDLAEKVTAALGGSVEPTPTPEPTPSAGKLYRVQVGAYSVKENAEKKLRQISATGTDCFITDKDPVDGFYRVQCGAYSIEDNAIRKMNELQYMGFDAIIKEYDVA